MQTLTRSELEKMNHESREDFVLINVLPDDKFRRQHIRTSVNVPVDDEGFINTVEKIAGSKDRKIVVYCASFDCDASEQAAKQLDNAGFSKVYDYQGGTKDWQEKSKN